MSAHQTIRVARQAILPFSDEQVFALVADIERYPDYLPSCRGARLLSCSGSEIVAELTIVRAGMQQVFATRNINTPPHRIDMALFEGPFRSLSGAWVFTAIGSGGCKVDFELAFEMKPSIFEKIIASMVSEVANALVDAVCQRAFVMYGNTSRD